MNVEQLIFSNRPAFKDWDVPIFNLRPEISQTIERFKINYKTKTFFLRMVSDIYNRAGKITIAGKRMRN